jgi:hypothetical protein
MRRALVLTLTIAAIAAIGTAASAKSGGLITKTSIAGAKPGQWSSEYRKAFGNPIRREEVEGAVRLVYPNRVDIYFTLGSTRGAYIVAASRAFKTSKGVGPCSTAAAVKRAHPDVVRVKLAGPEYALRWGKKLWFQIENGKVAAVGLGPKLAAWAASNTTACK